MNRGKWKRQGRKAKKAKPKGSNIASGVNHDTATTAPEPSQTALSELGPQGDKRGHHPLPSYEASIQAMVAMMTTSEKDNENSTPDFLTRPREAHALVHQLCSPSAEVVMDAMTDLSDLPLTEDNTTVRLAVVKNYQALGVITDLIYSFLSLTDKTPPQEAVGQLRLVCSGVNALGSLAMVPKIAERLLNHPLCDRYHAQVLQLCNYSRRQRAASAVHTKIIDSYPGSNASAGKSESEPIRPIPQQTDGNPQSKDDDDWVTIAPRKRGDRKHSSSRAPSGRSITTTGPSAHDCTKITPHPAANDHNVPSVLLTFLLMLQSRHYYAQLDACFALGFFLPIEPYTSALVEFGLIERLVELLRTQKQHVLSYVEGSSWSERAADICTFSLVCATRLTQPGALTDEGVAQLLDSHAIPTIIDYLATLPFKHCEILLACLQILYHLAATPFYPSKVSPAMYRQLWKRLHQTDCLVVVKSLAAKSVSPTHTTIPATLNRAHEIALGDPTAKHITSMTGHQPVTGVTVKMITHGRSESSGEPLDQQNRQPETIDGHWSSANHASGGSLPEEQIVSASCKDHGNMPCPRICRVWRPNF